jgi:hypothetical protein
MITLDVGRAFDPAPWLHTIEISAWKYPPGQEELSICLIAASWPMFPAGYYCGVLVTHHSEEPDMQSSASAHLTGIRHHNAGNTYLLSKLDPLSLVCSTTP